MILFITLPLLNVIISGLLSRYIGVNNIKRLNIINLFIILILLIYYYINIIKTDNEYTLKIIEWINIEYLNINYSFNLDLLSITMLIPIILISLIVNIFAWEYMKDDSHNPRFYTYLALFTLFMIILVLGDNYLILFLGWEYIGIASFLLIGFWYNNIDNIKSSLNALFINKIGDIFFIIALIYLIYIYKSLNYSLIFSLVSYINIDINNIIILCLVIAASAKSAQFGLHNWLIWAMAGPTPVSVLLHAATLVIAGIYLLMRSSPILENCPNILLFNLWLGAITSLISGLIAINSNDIKRIIALSTMSQLGIMFISIGLSSYNLTLYHVLCHSLYKALLFICAGTIIHSLNNELQDIRFMGGLLIYMPITYICMLIGSLSLMGLPSLTGYYSKDIIIESSIGIFTISGLIIYWLVVLSSLLTNIYILKLIYYSFINIPQLNKYIYNSLSLNNTYSLPFNFKFNFDKSWMAIICMIILSIGSLFIGYLLQDIYLGQGNSINGLFIYPNNLNLIETHFAINIYYKWIPIFNIFISILLIIYLYEFNYKLLYIYNNPLFYNFYILFNTRFLFDQILNNYIIRYTLYLSKSLNSLLDKGFLYTLGPNGLNYLLNLLSFNIIKFNTHLFNHYLIYISFSLLLFIYLQFDL
uniref:NADH-ubiquinone oxidoreductase chain 5 n=1 Tax=Wickerhamomyces canadensis TaxID=1156965 RepID=NU5M_WICCA|nr:NADH dehydrogenase subunit 5 [Wickerhamomyces canadensis]Q37024.2 RecName: Full=NADH-ubiquinone oxidoreductase chain 5 [Wickerhamomyces canadensis]BAA03779.2 NADH dehydrogenase subunit 5 [Wickerhamomyces canadensis]BAA06571.2 NADH dehydrogenase subunit 5 [Wickerhamomyces canadensis]